MTKPRSLNGINFALFGLGKFGKNYQRLLPEIKGVNLEATVTAHSGNAEEVLKNTEIDAIVIATPPSTHFDLAKAALEAGKHVLLEKPMVLSVKEAGELKEAIRQAQGKFQRNLVFMVGFQYLYNDYINWLKKEIERGAFGKILEVKSEHLVSPPREDVDIFWDAAPHPLAIYQYFFSPKKLISAEGKIEHDTAHVKVKFENAPPLEIVASCFGDTKTRKLTIVGEKTTAVLDETLEKDKLTIIKNGQSTNPQIEFKEPLQSEVKHFIQCIEAGATPLTNIDFGYQITEWLDKISTSVLN